MENLNPLGTVLSALVLREANASSSAPASSSAEGGGGERSAPAADASRMARARHDLHDMVASIKTEYRQAIERAGWLSERARRNLLYKALIS